MRIIPAVLAAVLFCALLAACAPTTVAFTFGADPSQVDETVVWADEGAGSGFFGLGGAPKIAIVNVRGVIDANPGSTLLGSPIPSAVDDLVMALTRAEEDDSVKGVVLDVNSPGGSVTASDMMYREIVRFKERTHKPVIAHLGEVAASGGYYISLAADEIIAQPTSLTGSIGVIFPTINVSEGLEKIGIYSRAIVSKRNKDLANPLEPPEEEDFQILQRIVDEMYARFRGLVLDRRPALAGLRGTDEAQTIEDATDGRILTGEEAVRIGLADSTGGLRDAFERMKALTDLDKARAVKYHSPLEPVRSLYSRSETQGAEAGRGGQGGVEINLLRLDVAQALHGAAANKPYYLWMPGGN